MNAAKIILASGSAIRAQILNGAEVPFDVMKPGVDEDVIKRQCRADRVDLETAAMALAEAKCLAVSPAPQDYVIGSDQILEFEGQPFDKPKSMEEARERLLNMAGRVHTLINAVAIARKGEIQWRHIDRPKLYMREIDKVELDAYLEAAGPDILSSVGAYQVEKLGARLFDRIEGDHYAVLGLSLYPLLRFLRGEGALAF